MYWTVQIRSETTSATSQSEADFILSAEEKTKISLPCHFPKDLV